MILFITDPIPDYGEIFLYNGLCEIFGADNIIDFPCKPILRGDDKIFTVPKFEKHNIDFIFRYYCYNEYREKKINDVDNFCQYELQKRIDSKHNNYNIDDIINIIKNDGFSIIISSEVRNIQKIIINYINSIIKIKNLVVFDGEDSRTINKFFLDNSVSYFKRELLKNINDNISENIFPYPFSNITYSNSKYKNIVCNNDKIFDLYISLRNTHSDRQYFINEISKDFFEVKNIENKKYCCFDDKKYFLNKLTNHMEYLQNILSSYSALNIRGNGFDCVRFWEIPYIGTCMISQNMPLIIPNDFEHNKNIIRVDKPQEIIKYFSDYNKLIDIGQNGREHILKYHTNKRRVEYFLNILNMRYNIKI